VAQDKIEKVMKSGKFAKAKKNINKASLLAKSRAFFDCTKPLVRRKSITHLIALNLLLSESLSLI